jgi:hypothetical protein
MASPVLSAFRPAWPGDFRPPAPTAAGGERSHENAVSRESMRSALFRSASDVLSAHTATSSGARDRQKPTEPPKATVPRATLAACATHTLVPGRQASRPQTPQGAGANAGAWVTPLYDMEGAPQIQPLRTGVSAGSRAGKSGHFDSAGTKSTRGGRPPPSVPPTMLHDRAQHGSKSKSEA